MEKNGGINPLYLLGGGFFMLIVLGVVIWAIWKYSGGTPAPAPVTTPRAPAPVGSPESGPAPAPDTPYVPAPVTTPRAPAPMGSPVPAPTPSPGSLQPRVVGLASPFNNANLTAECTSQPPWSQWSITAWPAGSVVKQVVVAFSTEPRPSWPTSTQLSLGIGSQYFTNLDVWAAFNVPYTGTVNLWDVASGYIMAQQTVTNASTVIFPGAVHY